MTAVPNDKLIRKIVEVLDKLGISQHDCILAEKYLNEEVGDEVLDQFERKDLTEPSFRVDSEVWAINKQVDKQEKRAVCVRFFNVIYAIGHGSCCHLYVCHPFYKVEECALYKRMILYITNYTSYLGYLNESGYNELMNMAQHNTQNLLEVLPFLKEESELYGVIVLAMYFCKKYENSGAVAAKDMALLTEYEDIVLGVFDAWLAKQGIAEHTEAVTVLREQKTAEGLFNRIELININEEDRKQFSAICTLAYLNFQLSDIMLALIQVCFVINQEFALDSLSYVYIGDHGCRTDISVNGGDYDALFHIDAAEYICWAAKKKFPQILTRQLAKNQEIYLKYMNRDECRRQVYQYLSAWGWAADSSRVLESAEDILLELKDVMKEANAGLYKQVVQNAAPDYDPIIEFLVAPTSHMELAKEYLRGNCNVSELYPYDKEFGDGFDKGHYHLKSYINKFQKHYKDEAFINRCRVFLVIRKFHGLNCEIEDFALSKKDADIDGFFANLAKEQLDIAHQLQAFSLLYKEENYYEETIKRLFQSGDKIFSKFLEEKKEETLEAFSKVAAEGRSLGVHILGKNPQIYKKEILSYAKDSSTLVANELYYILRERKDWEEDIKALLNGKKASERELAIRVFVKWKEEGGDYYNLLSQALQNEKSAKLVTILERALKLQEEHKSQKPLTKEELVRQVHQGGRKRTLTWAYETPFSPVHKVDGTLANEEYLQAILLCCCETQMYHKIDKNVQLLAAELNAAEFAVYVNELFDKWIASGAEAKKGWVLLAASIYGGEEMIPKLMHQIQEWLKVSRGAIAADAVLALAWNPSPRALLLVDNIARKFKHKQVKNGAIRALAIVAEELGISSAELADRIVPDLGFDENVQRIFDYGERVFTVTLTPSLNLEVYDAGGKKLKNLPAPAKKDDAVKAAEAYAAFKEMKKEIKAAITSQKTRLEYALSAKREWSVEAWKNLFVKNPLMHPFAMGLIWGIYNENGNLTQSFRYMEDGSFNTQDAEEYILPDQARISLVHPVELIDEVKAAWKEQLADYEITQPIEQLDRAVYRVTEEEADKKSMERFGGYLVNDFTLGSKLADFGWYRGSVEDAGSFNTYYHIESTIDMGVELHFSGSYVGYYQGEVTVYDARFYKAKEIAGGSYGYAEANKKNACMLKEVPLRYFSEIVLQIAKATASSDEREPDWKQELGKNEIVYDDPVVS